MWQFANTCTVGRPLQVIHELNSGLVFFPWAKGVGIRLEIEIRVIKDVVSDPPERISIIAGRPQSVGASFYRVSKHCKRGVILALENGTHYFDCIHRTPLLVPYLRDPETHPESSPAR